MVDSLRSTGLVTARRERRRFEGMVSGRGQDAAEDIREEAVEEIAEAAEAAEEIAEEPLFREPEVEPKPEIPPVHEDGYVYTCGGVQPIPLSVPDPKDVPAPKKEAAPVVSRQDKPLTTWGYLWRIFVAGLPIIGIIPLFVWAFASGVNKNSRGFARAVLIILLVLFALLLCGVILALVFYDKEQIADYFKNILTAIGIS